MSPPKDAISLTIDEEMKEFEVSVIRNNVSRSDNIDLFAWAI
jgi:hypothetical protein